VHHYRPDVRFLLIGAALFGEEEYERKLRVLTIELGLSDAVEFAGFRTDIHEHIAQLDIVVHASTTGEPFGQVIIEAMAAGKPVVATNGGGVPEIVLDGETGLLVPMGDPAAMADAIRWMIDNPNSAAEMGCTGRRRVEENFTIEKTVTRVEAVLSGLLQEAAPIPVGD
jgi:glycosyltransferase involved in cell wall biosynthesis